MTHRSIFAAALLIALVASVATSFAAEVSQQDFRGWKSTAIQNGIVRLDVVPEVGGRVMQFRLGDDAFLWVNAQLAGRLPPPGGVGPKNTWLNYGGDKLWPAPQGWDNDQQWPGPPDGVLDGSPYVCRVEQAKGPAAAVHLASGPDRRSGIQFSRTIRVEDGSSHVAFEATMKNVDTKARRWGIWSHTQLDGGRRDGPGHNGKLVSYCPTNPKSHFPKGYSVIFGAEDNPSFQLDARGGLMRVEYRYRVGKIGLDSPAGWIATVDGQRGTAFVQRFDYEADKEYPEGSSVEFWLNGLGSFRAWGKDNVMKDDPVENPYVFESEMLSPFARLQPGESYTWRYHWYACRIGGSHPVVACTPVGVTCQRLAVRHVGSEVELTGRFGVFYKGQAAAIFTDAAGKEHGAVPLGPVSPSEPLVLSRRLTLPSGATVVRLVLTDAAGKAIGELARAYAEDFSTMRGANYVPSYARNDVQTWMDYDPAVIDRELGYAARLKINTVRVFLQYAVYERDPKKFIDSFESFLSLCEKHNIRMMPVVFDSCFGEFPDLVKYKDKNWMANPGQNRLGKEHWPRLEQYVRDVVGRHKDDRRIVMWDVMNEPTCTSFNKPPDKERIWTFLHHMLDYVKQVDPNHPLTVGVEHSSLIPQVLDGIDVVATHNYRRDLAEDLRAVKELAGRQGKQIILNEVAGRPNQPYSYAMPIVAQEKVGWCLWELMIGRTQFTQGPVPYQGVIYPDGTCFDAAEIMHIAHPGTPGLDPRKVAEELGLPPRGKR